MNYMKHIVIADDERLQCEMLNQILKQKDPEKSYIWQQMDRRRMNICKKIKRMFWLQIFRCQ